MDLLPKELEQLIPKFYVTENTPTPEKVAVVKYVAPYAGWEWYAVEYDPETRTFFGLVCGFEQEWGYFSLDDFIHLNRVSLIDAVLRDIHFKPTKIKDLRLQP